jgi:hypothetical protein
MNWKRDWQEGDGPLILGVGMYLVFVQLQLATSGLIQLPSMLLSWGGFLCMMANLRRSNLERATRWFLGANIVHVVLMLVRSPMIADHPASRIPVLALVVGLIGSLVPMAMRRKAYGVLLAFLWAALLGTGWEELRTGRVSYVVLAAFGAGILAFFTVLYARWARTGQLPKAMRDVYDQLPADDSPLWTTVAAVKTLPESPAAFEKEPEPEAEGVRVGNQQSRSERIL